MQELDLPPELSPGRICSAACLWEEQGSDPHNLPCACEPAPLAAILAAADKSRSKSNRRALLSLHLAAAQSGSCPWQARSPELYAAEKALARLRSVPNLLAHAKDVDPFIGFNCGSCLFFKCLSGLGPFPFADGALALMQGCSPAHFAAFNAKHPGAVSHVLLYLINQDSLELPMAARILDAMESKGWTPVYEDMRSAANGSDEFFELFDRRADPSLYLHRENGQNLAWSVSAGSAHLEKVRRLEARGADISASEPGLPDFARHCQSIGMADTAAYAEEKIRAAREAKSLQSACLRTENAIAHLAALGYKILDPQGRPAARPGPRPGKAL